MYNGAVVDTQRFQNSKIPHLIDTSKVSWTFLVDVNDLVLWLKFNWPMELLVDLFLQVSKS